MKKMLDHKTVFFATALLFLTVTVFADEFTTKGSLPPKLPSEKASWSDQMKAGFSKFTEAILPEKEEPQKIDELSLSRKAKPSPELHTALAQSFEQQGQTQKSILEYEKALKLDPNHSETLSQYARFCDRINQPEKAEELFHKAVKLHPREAKVFNHQGLFFVRHQRYAEAAQAFSNAVALEPIKESYRGNLAVVLVDLGRHKEAYKQLRTVQSPDTAYYNLGFLLQERGKTTLAIQHFEVALQKNPDHKEARIWLNHLLAQRATPPEVIASHQPMQTTSQQRVFPGNPQNSQNPVSPNPNIQSRSQVAPNVSRPTQPIASGQQPLTQHFQMPQPEAPNPTTQVYQTPQVAPTLNPGSTTQQPTVQPWQPRMPDHTMAPVRTHSYYRSTIPPGRQQPHAVPIPGLLGPNAQHPMNVPVQNQQEPVQRNSIPSQQINSTQAEPPSLIAPADNTAPIRRLPAVTMRRTVNSSTDRYITPLPPVNSSGTFQPEQ